MAATHMQATGASLTNQFEEEKALRKAERNRRKKERKKQEKKRKAEEAASLAEQSPTLPKAERPTPSSDKDDTPTPAARITARVSKESLKSARARYSPVPTKVIPDHVGTPTMTSEPALDESGNTEQISRGEFATTQSPDPLTKEALQPARSESSFILPIDRRVPAISPSSLSVSEYENSVVMVDRPELDSFGEFTFRKPSIPDSVDSEDESIEETIITQGAKATLSRSSETLVPKRHLQALDLSVDPDESDGEELSTLSDSDPHGREPEEIKPKRHTGFPAPEDLPEWFPRNIKQIYRVDRYGGALSFKELNEITRYRAALEGIRRQKWNTYIQAGEARWKLQKILRRLRVRPLTKAFYEYRNKQYKVWKKKALKSWKRLEKTHLGVSILDQTININFRQERIIYEKKLGGRL